MLHKIKHLMNTKIKVNRSSIHSKGVFAKQNIKKGEYIIEYIGKKVTKAQSDKIFNKRFQKYKGKEGKEAGVYLFELNKMHDINGDVWYNPARFLNHSCNPNCETINEDDRIWIHAIKDIKKGEELTYNYGYDLDAYEDHPCFCGSKNCVGYIVAEKDWPKLKKKLAAKKAKKKVTKKKK